MKCREVPAACFVYLYVFFYSFLLFIVYQPPPLYFSIGVKLSPGYTRLKFSSRVDSQAALTDWRSLTAVKRKSAGGHH